jgi:serine/threonine protein kinase
VILYRSLTGRPAFAGVALPDMVYKVIHTMPPRPSATTPSLPPGIDDVLAVALAKDASQRFQSFDELVDAIVTVEQGRFDTAVRKRAMRLLEKHPWGADDAPESSAPSRA